MKHNAGFSCIELGSGVNTQVVPAAADPNPPEGFIDNTVYRYRMVNGEKVLIGTMDPFPTKTEDEGKRVPTFTPNGARIHKEFKKERGEDTMVKKYDWDILWPQVQQMQAAGQKAKEIADELEIDLSVLNSKIYREEKATKKQIRKPDMMTINPEFEAAVQEAEKAVVKQTTKRSAATINPEFDALFNKQTPDPEPEKVGRQEPVQEQEEPAVESVPEEVLPVKETAYEPTDNDFTEADDQPVPFVVIETIPRFDLARVKFDLIHDLIDLKYDLDIPYHIALGLIGAIEELQLREVSCDLPKIAAGVDKFKTVAVEAQALLKCGGTTRLKYQQKLSDALKAVGLEG